MYDVQSYTKRLATARLTGAVVHGHDRITVKVDIPQMAHTYKTLNSQCVTKSQVH